MFCLQITSGQQADFLQHCLKNFKKAYMLKQLCEVSAQTTIHVSISE